MTKKLEINFTKKPEIVFQFDQFLNVEQAVDKFLNKKENLKKLIAPLIPTNLEETIQKLIPEVSDGYTPQKGVDYDDGKDGETPSDEKIISLIKPQIPKVIPWKDGTTPKKGIDYFTKKELDEIKKELKTTILSEMPEHATKEEVNIKITEVLDKIRKLPTWGGGAQFLRQLMDVNVGNPTAQQYWLTYNPSRSEFALTPITWGGGGAVDSVNWQTGVVVLDQDDIGDGTTYKQYSATEKTKLAGIESGAEVNTIDTVSDTTEIDLAITARDLTATIRAGSIDESKLDASVNTSLGKADTAVQPAWLAGYELLSNKSTDTALGTSNTLYPTQNAVKTYVDNSVVWLLDDRGNYDASVNTFPASGGSGTAGAILKWDFWFISVAGTLGGVPVAIGDSLRSLTDTPWQTASNWSVLEWNIGYVPENVANKENTTIDTNTTKYPTVNLLKTGLDTKQATLVSGTNIKTVNSTTLLGSGDLAVATTAQGALADTALQPANISDTAYDATSWNGVTTIAPSKNAVRDKIETMDSAIALNTAKVTNATHSGDMTGDTALTAQPAIITGKASATVASGDLLLIADVNDSNNLKQVTAQSIADLSGGGGLTVGTTTITSGTSGRILYDNAGTLGEKAVTGTGDVVLATDPTIVTRINVPEIKATSSAGVDIHNNTGTQVALFGAWGGTGTSLVGTTNVGSASADYHQIAGGTGTITDTATGSSTNININLVPKGTGVVQSNGKTLANLTDWGTFAADISVPDEAYGSGWNGSVEVPTKNAIYDKIETLSSPSGTTYLNRPMFPALDDTMNTSSLNTNTTIRTGMFFLPYSITVNQIALRVTAVTVAWTINVSIFSENGQTQEIGVTSGTISGTGINTISVSAVTLSAWLHYFLAQPVSTTNIAVDSYQDNVMNSAWNNVSSQPIYAGDLTGSASTMVSTFAPTTDLTPWTGRCIVFRLDN